MNEARRSNVFHRFHLLVRETRCYIDDNDNSKSIHQKFFYLNLRNEFDRNKLYQVITN